jgi:hypothetical protein
MSENLPSCVPKDMGRRSAVSAWPVRPSRRSYLSPRRSIRLGHVGFPTRMMWLRLCAAVSAVSFMTLIDENKWMDQSSKRL